MYDTLLALAFNSSSEQSFGMQVLSRSGQQSVVAFPSGLPGVPLHTVMGVFALPPDRIRFTHLNGLLEGVIEELLIQPARNQSQLTLTASVLAPRGRIPRKQEETLQRHGTSLLNLLKRAAERRLPTHMTEGPYASPSDSFTSGILTESALARAVAEQEETEWGHEGHGRGVARVAGALADVLLLPSNQRDHLYSAALLHDAGKVGLEERVWTYRAVYTAEQRTLVEVHARLGYDLASRIGMPEPVRNTILHHHERWDGTGYPGRLRAEEIPLRSRVLFLAESIDSMLRNSYRRLSLNPHQAATVLELDAERRWDPMLAREAAKLLRGRRF